MIKRIIKNIVRDKKTLRRLKLYYAVLYSFKHSFAFVTKTICFSVCKYLKSNVLTGGGYFKACTIQCLGKGNRLVVGEGCKLNGVSFFFEGDYNTIIIGAYTIFNASKHNRVCINAVEGQTIMIGERCLFSNNIQIHTSDYHSIMLKDTRKRINTPKRIDIGNHCWIGLNSLILKGTVLSNDTIVGAGSIVANRYEVTNCILAGNPAKVIKENIDWDISKNPETV